MRIRVATIEDAPELGRVMVPSWLAAHRDHVPAEAWQKRVAEWTPDVSAAAWARLLGAQDDAGVPDDVLLLAEDESGVAVGLVLGTPVQDDGGGVAEIRAIYVLPNRHRTGTGTALLRACADQLSERGFSRVRVSVLTANLPARAFYESLGAHEIGNGSFDEEGQLLPLTVYEWPDIEALVG